MLSDVAIILFILLILVPAIGIIRFINPKIFAPNKNKVPTREKVFVKFALTFVAVLIVFGVLGFFKSDQIIAEMENNTDNNSKMYGSSTFSAKQANFINYLLELDADDFVKTNNSAFIGSDLTKVTSMEIAKEFDKNEVAAIQKYKDTKILISGKITGIRSGTFGEPYITLESKNMFRNPQVHLSMYDIDRASKLKKNQNFVSICSKATEVGSIPIISDCEFPEVYAKRYINKYFYEIAQVHSKNKKGNSEELSTLALYEFTAPQLPENCMIEKDKCLNILKTNISTKNKNEMKQFAIEKLKSKGIDVSALENSKK